MRGRHAVRMLVGARASARRSASRCTLTLGDAPILERSSCTPSRSRSARSSCVCSSCWWCRSSISALALGVAGVGDVRALGRIGVRTLAYTVVAVEHRPSLIGVGARELGCDPATGIAPALRARLAERAHAMPAVAPPSRRAMGVEFFVNLVPANPVRAMADGDMLAVMTFALLPGRRARARRAPSRRGRLEEALQGLYDVVMRLLDMVIGVAPLGVACLGVLADRAARHRRACASSRAYVGVVAARARHPAVRRLLGVACAGFGGMAPAHVLPRRSRGDGDGVLHGVEQRDAADRAARGGGGAPAAAARRRASCSPSARPRTRTARRSSRA